MKPSKKFSPPRNPETNVIARTYFRSNLILFIILLAGLILRLSYLFEFRQTPFFNARILVGLDQRTWDGMGTNIAERPWIADGQPFYQAPGYAYFLAAVYTVFGVHNYLAVGIFQAVLNLIGAYLLFLLGCRLWNRRVGLLSAALYAFYRPFIYYSATLLIDSFILFTNILCLYLVYWTMERVQVKHRWFLTGLCFGLATITKPTVLLFLFFSFLFVIASLRKQAWQSRPSLKLLPAGALFFLLGFLLFVLPVTVRNSLLAKKFVTVATYGTINWQIGNSADSIGLFYYPKGPLLSPKSMAFWKLWGRKTLFFFSSYEWPQNINLYLLTSITRTLKLPLFTFGFVVPLGLAGFLVFSHRRFHFLQVYTLANVLTIIAFFITSRYRLPATAGFMLLAAGYLDFLYEMFRKEKKVTPTKEETLLRRKNLVKMTASLLLIFVVSFTWVNNWTGDRIGEVFVKTYSMFTEQDVRYDLARGEDRLAQKKMETFNRFLLDHQSGRIQ